ncbi:MAG: glycerophosphodiester phosphodiesterase family protein [Pseudomonadota bacterium]
MTLPADFLRLPIAHRALHGPGAPENSRAAVRAAVRAGYGIEIDVQLSADGAAMVFHDYALERLCGVPGTVRTKSAAELSAIPLLGGEEGIPTLAEVLSLVSGQVPLLVELKDQDGAMGAEVGPLERAVAEALTGYDGPVAVMSFNPHSVGLMAELAPEVPRGLTTSGFDPDFWPMGDATCARLRDIPDYDTVGACFISHEVADLGRERVSALKAHGAAVLCWTVRSRAVEAKARRIAQNITFEGYAPVIPG